MSARWWPGARAVLLVAMLGGAAPVATAHAVSTFTVNSPGDEPDARPGDGVCASSPSGACTLRAAIMEANGLPGPDTIMLPAGVYTLTRPADESGSQPDTPALGDLDVTSDINLVGASARTTVIESRGTRGRALEIHPGAAATVSGIGVRGFYQQGLGGAILVNGGASLTLRGVTLRGNNAQEDALHPSMVTGGALANFGTMMIEDSAVFDNRAGSTLPISRFGRGGAIGNAGTLTVRNTTISNNAAGESGGAIDNAGQLVLTNATIAGNWAGFGYFDAQPAAGQSILNRSASGGAPAGRVRIENSIIASRSGGDNCSGEALESLGANIESGDTCRLNGPGDRSATDPRLAKLAYNGGSTYSQAPQPGSPAIDAAHDAACPSADQLGAPRPRDGNGDGNASCDVGAVEAPVRSTSFLVTSTTDGGDSHPGDGACADSAGACTLRSAIEEANSVGGEVTITLRPGHYDRSLNTSLRTEANITLVGASAASTVVDAHGRDRVFTIDLGELTLRRLTVTGGSVPATVAVGGGFFVPVSARLTLVDVAVTNNVAIGGSTIGYPSAYGGGIYNRGEIILENVSLRGNRAEGKVESGGGGIANLGDAVLTNVTFSDNTGAAIRHESFYGGLTLASVTVYTPPPSLPPYSSNWPNLYVAGRGPIRVRNAVLVNRNGGNCAGSLDRLTSLGGNLESGDSCRLGGPGDRSNVDPLLGPLSDNGGQTMTHALLPGSPAIDAGVWEGCPAADQRGAPRPRDGDGDGSVRCDAGAYEVQPAGDAPPAVCAPRPRVRVETARAGDGQLRAIISVQGANGGLRRVRVTHTANADVSVEGQGWRAGEIVVDLPTGTMRVDMLVRRQVAGQAATVQLVVTDGCGEWPTLVGGGPAAF